VAGHAWRAHRTGHAESNDNFIYDTGVSVITTRRTSAGAPKSRRSRLEWRHVDRVSRRYYRKTRGIYRLLNLGRHSRLLARIGPRHLVLWSFLMVTNQGAGLMLAPVVV
jgi:hypothetical protein